MALGLAYCLQMVDNLNTQAPCERHHQPERNSHLRHLLFEDDAEDLDAHRGACRQLPGQRDSHLYRLASSSLT